MAHPLTTSMAALLMDSCDAQAPGEAEAELAYLNRVGIIDAIISDDVDSFLFGATMLIRKWVPPEELCHSNKELTFNLT